MSALLRWALARRADGDTRRLEEAAADPRGAQERWLLRWLRESAGTAFGREHGFASITGVEDFRRRVPVRDFEALRPYVERQMAGERAVLTAAPPIMFALTSGTTGEPKYVPITAAAYAGERDLFRQWLWRAAQDHPALLRGSSLGMVSPAVEGRTAAGVPYGSASGLVARSAPWLLRRRYAIPYPVAEIADYETRYRIALRCALARRVSFVATANPSTLLRLGEVAARDTDALLRGLHDGTFGVDASAVPPAIQAALRPRLRRDPGRARALAEAARRRGRLHLGDAWPELALIGCWLGGSVGFHARRLAEVFGPDVPVRDLGYLASEGRMTVPLADGTPAGVLALHHGFFEFLPEDAPTSAGMDPGAARGAHELEAGARYRILLTTAGGLYRYDIHDVVEVAGFHRRAPLLAFLRKGRDMASITGEKMHANHVLAAMGAAAAELGVTIAGFYAVADVAAARYRFFVEWSAVDDRAAARLPDAIDRRLGEANLEYHGKRASGRLRAPCVHRMPAAWTERTARAHATAGRRDVQWKPPVLLPECRAEDLAAAIATLDEGTAS